MPVHGDSAVHHLNLPVRARLFPFIPNVRARLHSSNGTWHLGYPVPRWWHPMVLLLLLPLIGTLVPEFCNRNALSIGGMPHFYWYQFVWIPVSVASTWIVYRVTRRPR